jgi:aspartyl protease family protein
VSFRFNSRRGAILVSAELFGPKGTGLLMLALDTGATATMINVAHLVAVGYDPASISTQVQVTTGSGVVYVPRISVTRIKALGQERRNFPVLSHTLPPTATIDGLLGLDFLRDQKLLIDFRRGVVSIS